MRPKQWLKNVLVFAAPAAAGALHQWPTFGRSVAAFATFCLASGAIYLVNDAADAEADRAHPEKRSRPVASGQLQATTAAAFGVLLAVAATTAAFMLGKTLGIVTIVVYIINSVTYSLALKRIAVVELVSVAAGFVIRALFGAVVADLPLSRWFLICVASGALFVVAGKRLGELLMMGDAGATRQILSAYTTPFVRSVCTVACSGAVLGYANWALEAPETTSMVSRFATELSMAPMLGALLRYFWVIESGAGHKPERALLSDKPTVALAITWIAVYAVSVYAR